MGRLLETYLDLMWDPIVPQVIIEEGDLIDRVLTRPFIDRYIGTTIQRGHMRPQDVEDLVHDTVLKVLERNEAATEDGVRAFFGMVWRNKLVDYYRDHRRRPPPEALDETQLDQDDWDRRLDFRSWDPVEMRQIKNWRRDRRRKHG